MSVPTEDNGPLWRVGQHYGIHVYEDDRPVATFHDEKDAARAVTAVNRGKIPDEEFVLLPPRGWLNRVDEILAAYLLPEGEAPWSAEQLAAYRKASADLGTLVRAWAVGLDNDR